MAKVFIMSRIFDLKNLIDWLLVNSFYLNCKINRLVWLHLHGALGMVKTRFVLFGL